MKSFAMRLVVDPAYRRYSICDFFLTSASSGFYLLCQVLFIQNSAILQVLPFRREDEWSRKRVEIRGYYPSHDNLIT